jgi:hypothetical protein
MTLSREQRARKLTKWERELPVDAHLEAKQDIVYVIQSCNSPGSPEHPRWTTLYAWVYGDCLKPYTEHPHRVGRGDDSPKFSDLGTAMVVLAMINRANKGHLRSRLIVRHTGITEKLVSA